MYIFHASDPDSRPPPVSFSPPKAPPISAPDVPMFTLAIPQSDPDAARNASDSFKAVRHNRRRKSLRNIILNCDGVFNTPGIFHNV